MLYKIIRKIKRKILHYFHILFCRKNFIFRHTGPFPPEEREGCTFRSFRCFDDIPEYVTTELYADDIEKKNMDRLELDENGILWVAFVADKPVSTLFTRKGKHIRKWFFQLQPEDVVIFRTYTKPQYRGLGFVPSLIRYALHILLEYSGSAYIDCSTYNKASIRSILKSNFVLIDKRRAITRQWSMYK